MRYTGSLIWVEGIIGSGKTTFAQEVSSRLNLHYLGEPVGDGHTGNPYLAKFYQDPKTHAFAMQIFLLHRRYMMQQLAANEATGLFGYAGAILDRSLCGDLVFAKMLMRDGHISELDYQTYLLCYNTMCHTLHPPTLMVFLDATAQTAHDRMRKRNRAAESSVSLEYLTDLHTGYQEFLLEAGRSLPPWSHAVDILKLPWDDGTHTKEEWDAVAAKVKDACQTSAQS